ncbi:MAG TPA: class I SAM-dependent methyltransferase [Pyrinomonadaceae bacterium]|nr:class I SAM-dependent methyltransferase [Pyrinomonadaceae bacterium]
MASNGNMKGIRPTLEGIYWSMRRRITPTLQGSQDIYEGVLRSIIKPDIRWLDIGCGHQILSEWRGNVEPELIPPRGIVVGIDYDLPSLKTHRSISLLVRGDVVQLPFAADSFDLVTANMVVEHLENPEIQFAEISRVLKPGGSFLFHTPNARGYFAILRRLLPNQFARQLVSVFDGRDAGDVFPVQYKANTTSSIDRFAAAAHLEVTKTRMVVSEAVTQVFPPLAFFELLCIRALMTEPLRPFRTNIIALLTKKSAAGRATNDPRSNSTVISADR